MEAISKPTLNRLEIELPTNVCHLLRCGEFTVYDLLELVVNTVGKVVKSTDGNAELLENFAEQMADWSVCIGDDLTKWKDLTEKYLLEVIAGKEVPISLVISKGDIVWDYLSEDVQKMITNAGSGSGSGSNVTKIAISSKGVITVTVGSGDDAKTITGDIPFAKAVYESMPPDRPLRPGTDDEQLDKSAYGGLMSAQDWLDLQNVKKNMPYLDNDGNLVIGSNKYQLTPVEDKHEYTYYYDEIKVLSISYNAYSDGSIVSAAGAGKTPKSVTFSAVKHMLRDGEIYGSDVAVTETIDSDTNNLNANIAWIGTFDDDTAVINSSTGVVTSMASTKGYIASIGTVKCDVSIGEHHTVSCDGIKAYQQAASITLSKESITLPSVPTNNVTVKVTIVGGAKITGWSSSNTDVATVSYDESKSTLTVSGKTNTTTSSRSATITVQTNLEIMDGTTTKTKDMAIAVNQFAGSAELAAYQGMSAAIPTSISDGVRRLIPSQGEMTFSISSKYSDKVKVHWVAIPTGCTSQIDSVKDEEGDTLEYKTLTSISGYKLYYYESETNIQNTTNFKFK